jgi:hypothetical protein
VRTYKFWAALGALILSVTLGLGTRLETAQAQTPTDEPGNDQETLSGVTLQALGVEEAQEIELNNTSPVREINFYLPPGWTPIEGSTLDLSARYVTTGASDANPGVLESAEQYLRGSQQNLGSTVSQVSVNPSALSAPDASDYTHGSGWRQGRTAIYQPLFLLGHQCAKCCLRTQPNLNSPLPVIPGYSLRATWSQLGLFILPTNPTAET